MTTYNICTTDLSKFKEEELRKLNELIFALKSQGYPSDFYLEGVNVTLNIESGFVFLTNSEFQVAMVDDEGNLKSWYYTPYHGFEGFLSDLMEMYEDDPESFNITDAEYLIEICEINSEFAFAERIKQEL